MYQVQPSECGAASTVASPLSPHEPEARRLGGGGQGNDAFFHGVGDLVTAVPLSRLHHLAREFTTNDLLHALCYLNEAIQINFSLVAHGMQAVHQIFGADITRSARGKRTTTEAANRGVEVPYAALDSSQDIRNRHGPGVVRVQRPFNAGEFGHQVCECAPYLGRIGHTRRIGQADGLETTIHQAYDDSFEIVQRHIYFKGATERTRDATLQRYASLVRDVRDGFELGKRLGHRHVDVGQVMALAC